MANLVRRLERLGIRYPRASAQLAASSIQILLHEGKSVAVLLRTYRPEALIAAGITEEVIMEIVRAMEKKDAKLHRERREEGRKEFYGGKQPRFKRRPQL